MFGMSSEEFWEEDPKLYWAYRTFYLKQKEMQYEEMRYNAWLNGSMDYMAVAYALNNSFNKQKINYPSYNDILEAVEREKHKDLNNKDKNVIAQEEYNYWARR